MRYPHRDPELAAVVDRYVRPDRRYLELLHANFLHLDEPGRSQFVESLTVDAQQATTEEITLLFEGEWRGRLTAAYLVGMSQRTQFRDRVGELLLESQLVYAGQGYCYALARFGANGDCEILTRYLDRYLPQIRLQYNQDWAMGALLHLDAKRGTNHAGKFLAPNGIWETWANAFPGSPLDVDHYHALIARLCAL